MEKWRVLDMALGKRVSYPKRDARAAIMATREAIKTWVIDSAESRAATGTFPILRRRGRGYVLIQGDMVLT